MKNREFSEKISEKQASNELPAQGHRKLHSNHHRLREALALSCYFADQVFEARQQAIRCSTSGFLNLTPDTRRVELRKSPWGHLPGKALGDSLWIACTGGEKPAQADAGR